MKLCNELHHVHLPGSMVIPIQPLSEQLGKTLINDYDEALKGMEYSKPDATQTPYPLPVVPLDT